MIQFFCTDGRIRVRRGVVPILLSSFFFFLAIFPSLLHAQNTLTVKGKVVDEKKAPVPGASVTVKNANTGTSTNLSGDYTIQVAPDATLIFSAAGLSAKEVAVNRQTAINVTLTSSTTDLDQVVVVGYGTQKKRDVTGATVSVSEKALREVPVPNLQQGLIGRAAGLDVQQVSNQPGAGAQIRIRGIRSISGSNEPLFVVDGIPYDGSINDINPDEVASIDVLKDASATAIYGSRGANGVILVTTKRGRNGDTRVSYNGYYGIGTPAYKYPVFNGAEYQALRNISTWTAGYLPEEQRGIALGRSTDWQQEMYQNSYRTDHNINVSGGANGNTFSLGGGYYKESTLMPGEDFTRYTLRGAIDTRIGRRLKIGLTTQNTVSIANGSQFVSGSAMFRTVTLSPLMPAYDSLGNVYQVPNGNVDDNNSSGKYSPLLLKGNKTWVDVVRRIRTFNTLYAEYEFIKGLRYRFNLGLNYLQSNGRQFQGADQPPTNPSFFRGLQGNTARVDNAETWGYTAENLLFYDKTVGDHKFGFTGLYSIQQTQSYNTSVQKDSISADFVQFYNLALSSPTPAPALGGGESKFSLLSYMARLNYSFKDRYLLTATYRRDGSSRLAPGNQWYDYPAISAGWVLTDEPFLQKLKNVSNLKLRIGWGQTSNQSIDPYASLGLVNNSNGLAAGNTGGNIIRYNYGPTIVSGYNVVTLPNPNLSWEFTKTTNIGLDFGFLKNRITGSLELYDSRTDRILYGVNLPVTSGVAGSYVTNVGRMQNKGFEFSISSINFQSRSGFSWSTDLNLFANNNKLLALSSGATQDIGSQLFVGYSMTSIYDYTNQGVWQLNEAAAAAALGAKPGQMKLLDFSGPGGKPDGIISNAYDRHIIGNQDAKLQGGLTNRFSYKGLDLSIVMNARFGGMLISQIHQPLASYITILDGRRNSVKVDYWTPTNPSNWFPQPQLNIATVQDGYRTLGYYDASYVRIRSINLGYTLDRKWLQKVKAQSIRLYFTVDNVALLFSPYYEKTGIDPQATGAGDRGVGGALDNIRQNNNGNGALIIGLGTPPRRTYTLGLNMSF